MNHRHRDLPSPYVNPPLSFVATHPAPPPSTGLLNQMAKPEAGAKARQVTRGRPGQGRGPGPGLREARAQFSSGGRAPDDEAVSGKGFVPATGAAPFGSPGSEPAARRAPASLPRGAAQQPRGRGDGVTWGAGSVVGRGDGVTWGPGAGRRRRVGRGRRRGAGPGGSSPIARCDAPPEAGRALKMAAGSASGSARQ